jgi:mucin-19
VLGASVTLATTGGGATAGDNITLTTVNASVATTGAEGLTLNAGTGGNISLTSAGATTPLGLFSVSGANQITTNGNITTRGDATVGGTIGISAPLVLGASATLATTGGGATAGDNITLTTVNANTATTSAEGLTLNAGTGGNISLTSAGGTNPLGLFTVSGASQVTVNGNVTTRGDATAGGTIGISAPLVLGASVTLATTGGGATAGDNITLTTVNASVATTGAEGLTLNAGTGGNISLTSAGATTPLGLFSVSGANQITTNGNITTRGDATVGGTIGISAPLVLGASATLATTGGGATAGDNITFTSMINATGAGIQNLITDAGTGGTVIFNGIVGGNTTIGSLTASGLQIQIGANMNASGGTLTFNDPVVLTANVSLTDTGTTGIEFASTVDGAFDLSLTASGVGGDIIFGDAVGGTTPLASLTVNANDTVNIGGNITTDGGVVDVTGAAVLTTSVAVDTTDGGAAAAGADITFQTVNGTTAGAENFILTAGTGGAITLGVLGGTTALGNVNLISGLSATLNNIITQGGSINLTPPVTLQSTSLWDTTNGGADTAGGDVAFVSVDATTPGAESLTINLGTDGEITIGEVGENVPLGGFTIIGGSAIVLTADIITDGDPVSFSMNVRLANSILIDTTGGGGVPAGADITMSTIQATTAGAQSLTLRAGTAGDIVLGAVGGTTALGALDIVSAASATLENITTQAGAISIAAPTILGASATWNTASGAATGANITATTINAATATAGAEGLTLNAGTGGNISLTSVGGTAPLGLFSVTGANQVTIGGNITTRGNATAGGTIGISAPLVLGASATLATTGGGATAGDNITLTTVNATSATTGAQGLTLDAGTAGNISLTSAGLTTPLGLFAVSGANQMTLNGNITTRGDATAGGNISISAPLVLAANATLATTGGSVAAGDNITLTTVNPVLPGSVTAGLTLNAGTGGNISLTSAGGILPLGLFSVTGASQVTIGGNITTRGDATAGGTIGINAPLLLAANATLSTTGASVAAGDNITLTTVNVATAGVGAQSLTLNAGTGGNISLTSAGMTTPLGLFSVTGASQVTVGGNITTRGNATAGGTISIASPLILGASSTITTTGAGIVAGDNITFGSTINATSAGGQNLIADAGTGGTLVFNGIVGGSTTIGALTASGSQIQIGADMNASGGTLTFTDPVLLTADVSLTDTGTTGIEFQSTVDGAFDLELTASGSGADIVFTGAVGGTTPLTSLSANANDSITQSSTVTTTGAITYTGDASLGGNMTTAGGAIEISGSTILTSSVTMDTTNGGAVAAGEDVTLGAVDATTIDTEALTVNGGTSGIVTLGDIGGTNPLGGLDILGARVILNGNITTNGDPVDINPPVTLGANVTVDTTHGGGVAAGANVTFGSTIDATTSGAQTITILSGTTGNITVGGAIGNSIALSGLTMTTTNGDITLANIGGASPGLTGALDLTSTAGILSLEGTIYNAEAQTYNTAVEIANTGVTFSSNGSNITFVDALDAEVSAVGADITFNLDGGAMDWQGDVGLTGAFGDLVVNDPSTFTASAVSASTFTLTGGTGTTTFGGAIALTGAGGMNVTTGPIFLGSSIDADVISLVASTAILNSTTPVPITIAAGGTALFNALAGTVGTKASPIEINITGDNITVGADNRADFQGTPFHSSVDFVSGNKPCIVTFNGDIIHDCHVTPTPPSPPNPLDRITKRDFFVVGIYDAFNNLSNYFYFLGDKVNKRTVEMKQAPAFWMKEAGKQPEPSSKRSWWKFWEF